MVWCGVEAQHGFPIVKIGANLYASTLNITSSITHYVSITFRRILHPLIAVLRLGDGTVVMAHFYFHLSAPGEYFADNLGYDVSDPVAAHYIAVRLAGRVMKFVPFFQNRVLDFRQWTVKVADERQRPVMTVMFPTRKRRASG